MNKQQIFLQIACGNQQLPTQEQFQQWVDLALSDVNHTLDITLRIIDEEESQTLNQRFRNKNKPTNVLSFPTKNIVGSKESELGDLALCAPLIEKEAILANKALMAHWAHLVIHGVLHLRGFDHQTPADAAIMEQHEIDYLDQLGFDNPYRSS